MSSPRPPPTNAAKVSNCFKLCSDGWLRVRVYTCHSNVIHIFLRTLDTAVIQMCLLSHRINMVRVYTCHSNVIHIFLRTLDTAVIQMCLLSRRINMVRVYTCHSNVIHIFLRTLDTAVIQMCLLSRRINMVLVYTCHSNVIHIFLRTLDTAVIQMCLLSHRINMVRVYTCHSNVIHIFLRTLDTAVIQMCLLSRRINMVRVYTCHSNVIHIFLRTLDTAVIQMCLLSHRINMVLVYTCHSNVIHIFLRTLDTAVIQMCLLSHRINMVRVYTCHSNVIHIFLRTLDTAVIQMCLLSRRINMLCINSSTVSARVAGFVFTPATQMSDTSSFVLLTLQVRVYTCHSNVIHIFLRTLDTAVIQMCLLSRRINMLCINSSTVSARVAGHIFLRTLDTAVIQMCLLSHRINMLCINSSTVSARVAGFVFTPATQMSYTSSFVLLTIQINMLCINSSTVSARVAGFLFTPATQMSDTSSFLLLTLQVPVYTCHSNVIHIFLRTLDTAVIQMCLLSHRINMLCFNSSTVSARVAGFVFTPATQMSDTSSFVLLTLQVRVYTCHSNVIHIFLRTLDTAVIQMCLLSHRINMLCINSSTVSARVAGHIFLRTLDTAVIQMCLLSHRINMLCINSSTVSARVAGFVFTPATQMSYTSSFMCLLSHRINMLCINSSTVSARVAGFVFTPATQMSYTSSFVLLTLQVRVYTCHSNVIHIFLRTLDTAVIQMCLLSHRINMLCINSSTVSARVAGFVFTPATQMSDTSSFGSCLHCHSNVIHIFLRTLDTAVIQMCLLSHRINMLCINSSTVSARVAGFVFTPATQIDTDVSVVTQDKYVVIYQFNCVSTSRRVRVYTCHSNVIHIFLRTLDTAVIQMCLLSHRINMLCINSSTVSARVAGFVFTPATQIDTDVSVVTQDKYVVIYQFNCVSTSRRIRVYTCHSNVIHIFLCTLDTAVIQMCLLSRRKLSL
ncbi:hypothetical protein J6590_074577 [Homalodisca vitripennis]|nr:hypothetical protein J6590_074577 [Homalodisca vitripennis]